MTATTAQPISYGRRLSMLADEKGDATAIVAVAPDGAEREVSWRELDRRSNQVARLLASRGVREGSTVAVAVGNTSDYFDAAYATWKLGAMLLTLRPQMPAPERNAMLDVAKPALVVADWDGVAFPSLRRADLTLAEAHDDAPLPDKVSNPGRALGSGGSTGRPKIIMRPGPQVVVPGSIIAAFSRLGMEPGVKSLIISPVYHEIGFNGSHLFLVEGCPLVVMERFDALHAIELIERHSVNLILLAPIMMQRMLDLSDILQGDLSSLQSIVHAGAPCAPWIKRGWIDLIGAEKVHEIFGGTENNGYMHARGDEWLERPGTLGRPFNCEIRILDEERAPVPPGTVGEIFMKNVTVQGPSFEYIGAPPAPTTPDGFTSLGDMGWLDDDGYLFLADRRVDLIISGGANVYAAEVEMALSEHPEVDDIAVIGLPDETWGKRVHAVIQPRDIANPPDPDELKAFCRERLADYKAPRSWEFVETLPRIESGKIRRSALVAERTDASPLAEGQQAQQSSTRSEQR